MDALSIKSAHWSKELVIPGTSWRIKGYSRSAYRTGFYIPELDIMLDAGPQNFNKPTHIFITHTHIDHIACLPLTMIGDEGGDHIFNIYSHPATETHIHNYIKAMFEANAMSVVDPSPWYKFTGLTKSDSIQLTIKGTNLRIKIFECDHKLPTISYGFSEIKPKLKDEYKGISGKDLGILRKAGAVITEDVEYKKLAYVCDTSISVLTNHPEIFDYKVVMIECTFILPDELSNAIATQHIHWSQLKPYVQSHPEINFILFHFSMRYRDAEINAFFKQENLPNLQWWTNEC
ncbi:Hypothetical protein HVR_LOCUS420 [uncultured virus]|nr:Hypothetical protein HVR_LOCUS420 [uncultured virus]